ncbi:MAG: spore cortex biosynthesis protein YabQ [Bacillota bacterium]|nr:spore cortex biosynthesis protein YabQ [Bacillota bacterium]
MSLLLEQVTTFFMLMGAGMLMAFVFDIYRVARGIKRPPKLITHILDFIIWMILAILVFFLLIIGNWGEIRLYVFIGIIIGLGIYFKFLTRHVIRFLLALIAWIKSFFRFLLKVLSYPVRLAKAIVIIPIGIVSFILAKALAILLWLTKPLRGLAVKGYNWVYRRIRKSLLKLKLLFGRKK